ncbi:MAG: xanthine dehydrogenase family protein molybdopterin-binding subunit, partial [Verrucomicrobia bacterium]|nr:xanthine dehydrogenase family protein molybdopterin-binding subunit [Verrucomicrobiota bacterium]
SAVFNACTALKQRLVELAVNDLRSPLHGQALDSVVAVGDRVRSADPSQLLGVSFADIVQRAGQPFVEAKADFKPANGEKFSMHSFGAQFCEVHVDPDLGRIRVARWTGVFAPGKILNAKTARSQLIGGIVYGIGMALLEETVYDKRDGRIVNPNLAEYHVPVNADVPQMDIAFVQEEDPHINPLGVKGIGEIGITGVCAALANAVFHATGKRVRELPVTLDKLLG